MNPNIKAKWLSALKSGKYKQGKHILHSEERFCCLGVLCDLYIKENPDSYYWDRNSLMLTTTTIYFSFKSSDANQVGSFATIPTELKDWSGLSNSNVYKLSSINDSSSSNDYSSAIDYIEKEL